MRPLIFYEIGGLFVCRVLRPLSLKVRIPPFQGGDIGFKSHRGHCGYGITASTADCGSANGGSIPSGHINILFCLRDREVYL